MAIATFSDLKKQIINWSHRDDLGTLIDDFIMLAEKDMFKQNDSHEALDIRSIELTSTADVSTKEFALPPSYTSTRGIRLIVNSDNGTIRFKTPDAMINRSGTGRPSFFTVTNQFEFDVTPDQTYTVEVKYFAKPAPLSTTDTVNSVLTDHPDIYLFGSLSMLFAHSGDDENAAKYYGLFSQAIDGANQESKQGRYGPSPAARIEGPTP